MNITEILIYTYENHEKQAAGDDGSRDQGVPQDREVPEEMVHVVEKILVSSAGFHKKPWNLYILDLGLDVLESFRDGNYDFFQVQRKEIPERELQLNNAVTCMGKLGDRLDETTVENARQEINEMKDRWGVVTQSLDDFCNRDIPVSVSSMTLKF